MNTIRSFGHTISFRTKSMCCNNFVIHYFPGSCIIFKIGRLTSYFASQRRCKQSHRIQHYCHFAVHKHYIYDSSCRHLKAEWMKGTTCVSAVKYCKRHLSTFTSLSIIRFKNISRPLVSCVCFSSCF